ncbi:MAG TPA: conjugative transposon protein TraN [Puia sp.]|jgi:conjugative transposon TraN protein|nr:conjugative transposon protein TraN [Puia sp.]
MKMFMLFNFLVAFWFNSFSQSSIASFPISICCNKTTNIIFPYAIAGVDRGSENVLAQKAKGTENILQLKAAKENFQSTNLSVITSSGKLYSFEIIYSSNPPALNFSFANDSIKNDVQFSDKKINDAELNSDALIIRQQKHFLHQQVFAEGMKLSLHGIYLKAGTLWFLFEAENHSFLDYHPDYLHCYIEDKRKAARTAVQQVEIPFLYPPLAVQTCAGKKREQFVLAFSPFTFSGDKKLVIQMSEKNGGRFLSLSTGHKTILKARFIQKQ